MKHLNVELKWTHAGQYHPYGGTYRICEIHTPDLIEENDILLLVGNGKKLSKDVFDSKKLTMLEYFTGYYTIEKTDYGYLYTGVEPYCD